jgi:hypothetical protein
MCTHHTELGFKNVHGTLGIRHFQNVGLNPVEPVLPLLLPLALISSCIAFSHQIVSIGIAQLAVCWL